MAKKVRRLSYTAPPVIEALVQLFFPETVSASVYAKLVKRLARSYANNAPSQNVNARIDFAKRGVDFDTAPQHRLSSQDETDVLIIQPNALTWSRLAPYEGWEPLFARVQKEVEEAYTITKFRKLGRIGMRYINRLDVPSTDDETRYEDYLKINIDLPEKWQLVNNYAWRFERPFEGGFFGIVQSAVIEPEIPNYGAFLLDIDVVLQKDLPTKIEDIFTKLSEMRALKNEIFKTCISDKARASFTS